MRERNLVFSHGREFKTDNLTIFVFDTLGSLVPKAEVIWNKTGLDIVLPSHHNYPNLVKQVRRIVAAVENEQQG
jgi:hypothetical protein